jgi:hypothetical protein
MSIIHDPMITGRITSGHVPLTRAKILDDFSGGAADRARRGGGLAAGGAAAVGRVSDQELYNPLVVEKFDSA